MKIIQNITAFFTFRGLINQTAFLKSEKKVQDLSGLGRE